MDVVRVQILASSSEKEKRDSLVEKLESISYLKIEKPIDENYDIIEAFENDRSDVVLMFEHYNGNGYVFSQEITTNYPNKAVLMIKSDMSKINVREVVRSGASDIISFGSDVQALTEVIYSTYKTNSKKQEALKSGSDKKLAQEGKVYTIFSTKGGSGQTFVATNLAVTLAKDKDARVALIDLDIDYGGVDLAMNLNATTSITDAVEDIQHLDSDLMESYLTKHSSGVYVLAGNSDPTMGDYINSEQVGIILNILKLSFDHIVVDMPGRFMEANNPTFTLANTVFLVTTPEILTLRNTRSALAVFEELDYPMDRIKVILNKVAFGGISRRDVESTLGHSIFEEIPEDTVRVRKSQNEGRPYVMSHQKRPVSKAFDKIVGRHLVNVRKGRD